MHTSPSNTDVKLFTAYTAIPNFGLYATMQHAGGILQELATLNKEEYFKAMGGHENPDSVLALIALTDKVPTFQHAIIYNNVAYIDLRPWVTREGKIRDTFEVGFILRRAKLDLDWAYRQSLFLPLNDIVVDSFSTWFANGISRRLDITSHLVVKIRILAAIYYLGMMDNASEINDRDLEYYLMRSIPRMLGIPVQLLLDLFDEDKDTVLDLYRKSAHSVTQTNKLSVLIYAISAFNSINYDIDVGVVQNSVCGGAIIVANAINITATALEHPPTFIMMMFMVMQKGNQSRTTLGLAVDSISRRHDRAVFDKFINSSIN